MSTSERVTAAELERSRRARSIAKNWLESEEMRLKLAGLDPALEGDGTPGVQMRPSKFGRPSPLDRVREARVSGLEIREFEKGLSEGGSGTNPNSKPVQLDPNTVIQAKATIVNALAANHTPEQIAVYLEKVSPFLDTAMLAGSDPLAQSLLYAKVMSSNQQQPLGLKDVIELVGIVNQAKSQQPQLDPASMTGAVVDALKAGLDAGKSNSSDPVRMMEMIASSESKAREQQLAMYERLLQERNEQPSLISHIQEVKELQNVLGIGPKSEAVQAKELEIGFQKWQAELNAQSEERKSKNQSEMVKQITGGLSKALETPIIRELGKKAASAIPGVAPIVGAVTAASASATKQALEEPLEERFSLDCAGCGTRYEFSRKQITLIQDGTGKWSCPKCGYTYDVGSQTDQKNDGPKGA